MKALKKKKKDNKSEIASNTIRLNSKARRCPLSSFLRIAMHVIVNLTVFMFKLKIQWSVNCQTNVDSTIDTVACDLLLTLHQTEVQYKSSLLVSYSISWKYGMALVTICICDFAWHTRSHHCRFLNYWQKHISTEGNGRMKTFLNQAF